MSKPENPKPSLFQKVVELGNAYVDSQIFKAKTTIINSNIEDDFYYGKAVIEDPSYSLHSQGFTSKPGRLENGHLKQMSYQDSVIAATIQTRQNQASLHSKLVKSQTQKGFMILLRDEDALLEKIKDELRAEKGEDPDEENEVESEPSEAITDLSGMAKADSSVEDLSNQEGADEAPEEDEGKTDDEVEAFDFELERRARDKINKQYESSRRAVEQYILNCGKTDNRPFETKRWNFEAALRAWTRDTLTYDLYASEKVPDKAGRPHHWFPMDGGTVKFASKDLKKFKDPSQNFFNIDILYPDRSKEAQEKEKVIDLKQNLLDKDAYKFVQVVRGKVERAYTVDELAVGIRNVNTDIYNNGYGLSELELLVWMITGHLNAEYYNQAYFTQGFSAKGILHIKAAINRRKLETVRTQWQHMLKGTRNAFQTPIFAGVEDVKWLPLTQNHNDIGFEGWMRYLVTMIGAIFQIDPAEMGIHFKTEGSGGSLGTKDDTQGKINNSKDRGFHPLMSHFENYINEQIIKPFDSRFIIKFTGVDGETGAQVIARQEKEVKFKKTVNEIRAEDGLPPLPGMDFIILDSNYMQWFNQHSDQAKDLKEKDQKNQMDMMGASQPQPTEDEGEDDNQVSPEDDVYGEGAMQTMQDQRAQDKGLTKSIRKSKKKPLVIEVYKIEK